MTVMLDDDSGGSNNNKSDDSSNIKNNSDDTGNDTDDGGGIEATRPILPELTSGGVPCRCIRPQRKCTKNYEMKKIMDLLSLIREHLPIDKSDWETVVEQLVEMGHEGSSVESVKRKFKELFRKETPTGDPSCPLHILEAKDFHCMIGDLADVGIIC